MILHNIEALPRLAVHYLIFSTTNPNPALSIIHQAISETVEFLLDYQSNKHTAMELLKQILACIIGQDDSPIYGKAAGSNPDKAAQYTLLSEKIAPYHGKSVEQASQDAAAAVFSALQQAEKRGRTLEAAVQDIVRQAGFAHFTERIARKVLDALQSALKEGSPMREAMKDAYEKAINAADGIAGFSRQHPVLTGCICAVIALGILMILAPAVVHALGFGIGGVVEGDFLIPVMARVIWLIGHRLLCCKLAVDLWWGGGGWVGICLPAEAGRALLGLDI